MCLALTYEVYLRHARDFVSLQFKKTEDWRSSFPLDC